MAQPCEWWGDPTQEIPPQFMDHAELRGTIEGARVQKVRVVPSSFGCSLFLIGRLGVVKAQYETHLSLEQVMVAIGDSVKQVEVKLR